MYSALWRILPRPVWLRIILVFVMVAVVLAVLSFWVFPWVDLLITPAQQVTVDQ